jgi:hypothetical protein
MIETAVIINMLYAAEPTIVPGPSSPDSKLLSKISSMARMISGADEPRAMSVRLAIVAFHTSTVWNSSFARPFFRRVSRLDVMRSMA